MAADGWWNLRSKIDYKYQLRCLECGEKFIAYHSNVLYCKICSEINVKYNLKNRLNYEEKRIKLIEKENEKNKT